MSTLDRLLDTAHEEARLEMLHLLVRLGRRSEGAALASSLARLAGAISAIAESAVLLTDLPRCPISADEVLAGLREQLDDTAALAKSKVVRDASRLQ